MSNEALRVDIWLKDGTQELLKSGVSTARLDCLVLLEDITGRNRASILAHPEAELTSAQLAKLSEQIRQRSRHIPLAYIRGMTEFYGRVFSVNDRVLEPRPESEAIIELLRGISDKVRSVIDIGTGSGALAITAKLEHPQLAVLGIDIDPDCLAIAQANAAKHRAAVTFQQSDLLKNLSTKDLEDSVLLANLPYVPDEYPLNRAATHEPELAIFGGKDGLDLYRVLFTQSKSIQSRPRFIITESLPAQHTDLTKIAHDNGYGLIKSAGLVQLYATT